MHQEWREAKRLAIMKHMKKTHLRSFGLVHRKPTDTIGLIWRKLMTLLGCENTEWGTEKDLMAYDDIKEHIYSALPINTNMHL